MQFLRSLWRGNISLYKTYWYFSFLPNLVFTFAFAIINSNYLFISISTFGNFSIYLLLITYLIYKPFILVALWRSSERYTGFVLWRALAKLVVIFGLLSTILIIGNLWNSYKNKNLDSEILLLNKSMPTMLDEQTQILKITIESNKIIYHLRLINYNSSQFNKKLFFDQVAPLIKQRVCSMKEWKELLLSKKMFVNFSYEGKDKRNIEDIIVDPSQCK